MQDRDIEGALHAAMQNSRIHGEELLSEATCILDHSLQKMSGIILAILEEIEASEMRASLDVGHLFSARYSVFVMDLEEEIGYKVFLAALPAVLDRVLSLGLLSDEATDESKEKQKLLAKEKAKWQKILSVVQSLQKTISSADKPPVCCAAS
jgi:hypothetical protein